VKESRRQSIFRISFRSPQRIRAFSLYDALVTVAVVSTVATIGVPSFQQLVLNQRMAGAINAFITALHLARSEAIKRGENAVLCPSTDGRNCINRGNEWEAGYLLYIDRDGDREIDADETVVRVFGATNGLRLKNTSRAYDNVRYMPNGLAEFSNMTFTFCDVHGRGTPKAVVISRAGRVRTATRMPDGDAIVCPNA
jgi:type IV fimbrial biogenesis protein FimT